jgi:hypothetical protein
VTGLEVWKALTAWKVPACPVAILAIRKGGLGRYDDDFYLALGWDGSKSQKIYPFGGNTSPSHKRRDGIAELTTGQILWNVMGIHGITRNRPRPAFRQAVDAKFFFRRVGSGKLFRAFIAANTHDGGWNNVSSLACLTMRPDVFKRFKGIVYSAFGWTDQKSWADPEGYDSPRFPILLLSEKELDNLPEPEPEMAPLSPWTILKGKPGEGVAWKGEETEVDGQVFVPVRSFASWLTGIPEAQVPISVSADSVDEGDEEDISINGHVPDEVHDELRPKRGQHPRLWCWVRDVAKAFGYVVHSVDADSVDADKDTIRLVKA